MDLNQLKYFQAVAYVKSFSVAAKKLYVTQPTISIAISKLEEELDVNLFLRSGKSVELTEYGEILLKATNDILGKINNTKLTINQLKYANENIVKISVTSPQFLQGINIFLDKNCIKFKQTVNKLEDVKKLMDYNLIDISITSPGYESNNIKHKLLFKDEFMLAVHKDNRLSKLKEVCLNDLKQENFILLDSGFPFRQQTDLLFESLDFTPNVLMECDHELRRLLLNQNSGITISSKSAKLRGLYDDVIKFIPINDVKQSREIVLSWNKNVYSSKGVEDFCKFIINYYNNLGSK